MSEQKQKPVTAKAETPVAVKSNIEGLADLQKEYVTGRMVEKKIIALRRKLVELFLAKKITPDEQALMEIILGRDRVKGSMSSHDEYLLNKIESDRCEERCIVKTQSPPQVHHMVFGMECRFSRDVVNNKFSVYIPRVVPPEHQMTRELLLKEARGHFASEDEYPKPKILTHRIIITEKEFGKWFDVIEDDILTRPEPKREESYTF